MVDTQEISVLLTHWYCYPCDSVIIVIFDLITFLSVHCCYASCLKSTPAMRGGGASISRETLSCPALARGLRVVLTCPTQIRKFCEAGKVLRGCSDADLLAPGNKKCRGHHKYTEGLELLSASRVSGVGRWPVQGTGLLSPRC